MILVFFLQIRLFSILLRGKCRSISQACCIGQLSVRYCRSVHTAVHYYSIIIPDSIAFLQSLESQQVVVLHSLAVAPDQLHRRAQDAVYCLPAL